MAELHKGNFSARVRYEDHGLGARGWVAEYYEGGSLVTDSEKIGHPKMPVRRDARAGAERVARAYLAKLASGNRAGGKRTAKHRNRSAHTRAPVTVSGWYEHSDGTIGHYVWRGGSLVLDQVVPSWSDVESAKSEALSLPPMNYAGGKRTAKRSSNRAGSINSRKISAAARAHVDDLVYSQGWSPADVASDPRPLESWEGPQILESAGLTQSATDEQYAAARRALAAAIRAYADKLSRSKANRAGTKRRATKKTANKAGKRRNRAGRTTNPIAIVQDMPQGHYVASSHYTQKAAVAAARKRGAATVLEVPASRFFSAVWHVVIPKAQ